MEFLKAEIERKKRQMQDSKLVGPGKNCVQTDLIV
jgi:hypothetical protein